MTTKKLSDLPAAAPILGTETVFGLQSGFSVQIPYGSFNGITTTGNVGIGTSSPSYKLDVGSFSTASTQTIRVAAAANNDSQIKLMEAADSYGFTIRNVGASGLNILRHSGDATGATALFIDRDTGNVGIGTSSPDANYKLEVVQSANIKNAARFRINDSHTTAGYNYGVALINDNATVNNYTALSNMDSTGTGNAWIEFTNVAHSAVTPQGAIGFTTRNGSNYARKMTIDMDGNVGIGTSSPSVKLQVAGNILGNDITASVGSFITNRSAGGAVTSGSNIQFQLDGSTYFSLTQPATGALAFNYGTATERMRIDDSGNLLVGTTSSADPIAARINGLHVDGTTRAVYSRSTSAWELGMDTTSGNNINFYTDNGTAYVTAGSIASNGSVTTFNVSSDYRLKQSIVPLQNSLSKVMQLNPCSYEYIEGDQYFEGFIAHELQAIVPICVTGEKDAVDADGKPTYQSVDASKLVATLTAAIQELKAIIDTQQEQINSLLGK